MDALNYEHAAERVGYYIIPNREDPEDGFGPMSMFQWLYPDGTKHKELPDINEIILNYE